MKWRRLENSIPFIVCIACIWNIYVQCYRTNSFVVSLFVLLSFFFFIFLILYFQDDHKAFRRQLEDKRPIVESNLLNGKQYVASEPPVSDASDTESKFAKIMIKIKCFHTIIAFETKRWWVFSLLAIFIEIVFLTLHVFFVIVINFILVLDNDSRYLSAEEQSRELTRSITREVGKLSEQWNHLIDHSDNWKHSLDEFMTVSSYSLFFCIFPPNVSIVKVFDFYHKPDYIANWKS